MIRKFAETIDGYFLDAEIKVFSFQELELAKEWVSGSDWIQHGGMTTAIVNITMKWSSENTHSVTMNQRIDVKAFGLAFEIMWSFNV